MVSFAGSSVRAGATETASDDMGAVCDSCDAGGAAFRFTKTGAMGVAAASCGMSFFGMSSGTGSAFCLMTGCEVLSNGIFDRNVFMSTCSSFSFCIPYSSIFSRNRLAPLTIALSLPSVMRIARVIKSMMSAS